MVAGAQHDKHREPKADGIVIEPHGLTFDDAHFAQFRQAAPTRVLRQPNFVGQFALRKRGIALQGAQDRGIYRIQHLADHLIE